MDLFIWKLRKERLLCPCDAEVLDRFLKLELSHVSQ